MSVYLSLRNKLLCLSLSQLLQRLYVLAVHSIDFGAKYLPSMGVIGVLWCECVVCNLHSKGRVVYNLPGSLGQHFFGRHTIVPRFWASDTVPSIYISSLSRLACRAWWHPTFVWRIHDISLLSRVICVLFLSLLSLPVLPLRWYFQILCCMIQISLAFTQDNIFPETIYVSLYLLVFFR